ncbi:histidine phosphatase family protein [Rhodovibrionaceae bacterium A322]
MTSPGSPQQSSSSNSKTGHRASPALSLPPQSFCLIRHGETTANRDHLIAGRLDVPLTDKGRRQAEALLTFPWPADLTLFSSPLSRARETCARAFPGRDFQVHPDLRERDWGCFEGQPLSQAPARESHPLDGESWPAMQARVCGALLACCEKALNHQDMSGPALKERNPHERDLQEKSLHETGRDIQPYPSAPQNSTLPDKKAQSCLPVFVCHSGVIRVVRLLAGLTGDGTRPAHATPCFFIWDGQQYKESSHACD